MRQKSKKIILIAMVLFINTVLLLLFIQKADNMIREQEEVAYQSQSEIVEIYTLEDYLTFAETVTAGNAYENSVVRLCADLDFSEYHLQKMIGDEEQPFSGVFDGNGYCILGMRIENSEGSAGLIANLYGTVKNLRMENCEFSGKTSGSVAASSYNAAILNCEIDAEVNGDVSGSIVGVLHGNIFNCVAASEEFAGEVKKGSVENCFGAENSDIEALNKNLSFVSGYYNDVEFCRWEDSKSAALSKQQADLLKSLTARMNLDGKEFKLKAYYSGNDRKWCIALPAGYRDTKLTVEALSSQGGYEKFKRTQGEETIIFTWKDRYYPIEFLCADNVDTLYVTLEQQKSLKDVHNNKLEEIPGVLTVMDTEGNVNYEVIKGFYGHGNDSWAVEKKSYNLKFDTLTDILGMGENEDFSLLACYRDNSLMCYCTTTELIKELGFAYPPQFRLVNLYVKGEYAGVYFLAEKVELDKNRIEITNVYEETKTVNYNYLEGFTMQQWKDEQSQAARYFYDVENNPEDITGGYLLEADIVDYGLDESRFVSKRGIPMTLKRARYSSERQVNYIADFWQEFEDALFSEDGKNTLGKHYTEYIDVESFAMQWLIYELVQEGSMSSSIYFYKESDITGDGLLHACFPWDMEHSYVISDQMGKLWNTTEKSETLYGYWKVFYSHEDFKEQLRDVWVEKFIPAIETMISEEAIETQSGMRNLRWYEERIVELDRLENSRWRKMYPLNRCQTNREFLTIRMEVLSALLFE